MSKPLSEQVAELERRLEAVGEQYNDTRRLNKVLEADRDRLLAAGDLAQERLDLVRAKAERLEAENAALRAEKTELESELRESFDLWVEVHEMYDDLKVEFTELQEAHEALRAQNEALRAGQGRWPEGDDSPAGEQVPRVISADELREGQTVAWIDTRHGHLADAGVIRDIARAMSGNLMFNVDPKYGSNVPSALHCVTEYTTIVLLEDAPEPEPTVVHDDDGKPWDVEVRPVEDPTPRLTVHALNTAPVGSVVTDDRGAEHVKTEDGDWRGPVKYYVNTEIVQWANATLTHPERGDHE